MYVSSLPELTDPWQIAARWGVIKARCENPQKKFGSGAGKPIEDPEDLSQDSPGCKSSSHQPHATTNDLFQPESRVGQPAAVPE